VGWLLSCKSPSPHSTMKSQPDSGQITVPRDLFHSVSQYRTSRLHVDNTMMNTTSLVNDYLCNRTSARFTRCHGMEAKGACGSEIK